MNNCSAFSYIFIYISNSFSESSILSHSLYYKEPITSDQLLAVLYDYKFKNRFHMFSLHDATCSLYVRPHVLVT